MRSYASVDRIEDEIAVCEVELIPTCESRPEDYRTKPTYMMEITIWELAEKLSVVCEGDIIEVEHDGAYITEIYTLNLEEKQRRINLL